MFLMLKPGGLRTLVYLDMGELLPFYLDYVCHSNIVSMSKFSSIIDIINAQFGSASIAFSAQRCC